MLSPEQEKKFNKKSLTGCGITIQLDPYQQDMVMSGAGFKDFIGKIKQAKIGKKIIKFGIKYLKEHKVDILMTYGDPSYYSKIGFKKTKVSMIPAPYKLSQPIGWLINKISSKKINKFKSKPNCVRPFRNKKLW